MTAVHTAPQPRPLPYAVEPVPARAVTVAARLLPQEIIASRRLRALKKKLGYGVVLLALVLVLAFVLSWLQTGSARGDLTSEENRTTQAQQQLGRFAPLLSIQQQVSSTTDTLRTLMTGNVEWRTLLTAVRAAAPHGVQVAAMTGAVSTSTDSTGTTSPTGLQVLNASGQQDIGTLGITGTAPSKEAVAAYVDALAKVKGLAAPFPASIATSTDAVSFDVNVLITKSALSKRYTASTATGTGK